MWILFKKTRTLSFAVAIIFIAFNVPTARAQMTYETKRLELSAGEKSLLINDFNHDGFQDLVIALEVDNFVSVMLGNGKGGFGNKKRFPAGENPASMASADFNADGNPDLTIANHEEAYLTILLGDGAGRFFQTSSTPLSLTTSPHSHVVNAADMDGDGLTDILVDSRDEFGVYLLKGLGDSRFDTPGVSIDVGGRPYLGFAIADINGDGLHDIVTPNVNDVSVLMQSQVKALKFDHVQSIVSASPFAVELAEMNGDGYLDLIIASGGDTITIYMGDNTGLFSGDNRVQFQIESGAKGLTLGDVNGDGLEDVIANSWNSDIRIIFGNKSQFQSQRLVLGDIETPWGIAVGDLNGDGYDDIVVADGTKPFANIYFTQVQSK